MVEMVEMVEMNLRMEMRSSLKSATVSASALCRSRRRERKRGLNCVFKEQTVFRQYSALGMDCTLGGPNYLL